MSRFSAATQAWFDAAFPAPTAAQEGAWDAIGAGRNALVVAPTGSGKTLAAFLWSLDRLASEPPPAEPQRRCRVLYVSPLKALAVDVERNLRAPLAGIRHAATRLGLPEPDITVGVRSGDTPADERRRFGRTPPDILITTPESLFLMLTSQARESLRGVETVIVDEVHAVAGTKRGAHLALSLERLDALLEQPAQRIGLSRDRPPGRGGRPVPRRRRTTSRSCSRRSAKTVELEVVVPVEDLAELGQTTGEVSGSAAGEERRTSIWPHVEERIVDLVEAHRSTIVFANSRRLAERLCARLNEIHDERATGERLPRGRRGAAGRRSWRSPGPPLGARARAGPGPPRLGVQGAARPDRGGAQGRPAARGGRDLQPRARHRHGRGRPRHPGRVAAVGGQRPAAGRPGRPPGRRRLARRHLPEVPRRPGADRRGRRADAGRRRSRRCATRATRSTCSPSRSSRWCAWTSGTSR